MIVWGWHYGPAQGHRHLDAGRVQQQHLTQEHNLSRY